MLTKLRNDELPSVKAADLVKVCRISKCVYDDTYY